MNNIASEPADFKEKLAENNDFPTTEWGSQGETRRNNKKWGNSEIPHISNCSKILKSLKKRLKAQNPL
jgi:hypothetical protein